MSFNFKQSAEKAVSVSVLATNREKLDTEAVLGKQLTIAAVDVVDSYDKDGKLQVDANGEVMTHAIMTFDEYPTGYYHGTLVPSKIIKQWIADLGGIDECNNAIAEGGGVKVYFYATKTRSNNKMVMMDVI